MSEVLPWLAFGGVLLWLGTRVREYRQPSDLERLKKKVVAGELSQDEYERRLELVLDDEVGRIQAAVEPIPGIGPERSRYVAARYNTLEELRQAEVEELEQLPEIGEQRAAAIKERLT